MAFSSDAQYSIYSAGDCEVLGPRTAVISRSNQIYQNVNDSPRLAGLNVVFATDEPSNFTNFREYRFSDRNTRRQALNLGDAANIMIDVPKYIPGSATLWDISQSRDYMAVYTPAQPNSIYVYKYLWSQQGNGLQRVQEAWSRWEFSRDVRSMLFNHCLLYTSPSPRDS